MKAILKVIGRRPDVRCWRNTIGLGVLSDGSKVRFGLPGSSDILGILQVGGISGAMLGMPANQMHRGGTGLFLAIEVKSHRGVLTEEQKAFLSMVTAMGGCAVVARSVEDAERGIEDFIRRRQLGRSGSAALS